jgi:hypothetical protein
MKREKEKRRMKRREEKERMPLSRGSSGKRMQCPEAPRGRGCNAPRHRGEKAEAGLKGDVMHLHHNSLEE